MKHILLSIAIFIVPQALHAELITFEGVAAPGDAAFDVAPYMEGNFLITASSPNNAIFSASNVVNSAGFASDFFGWDNTIAPPEITLAESSGLRFDFDSIEIGDLFFEGPSEITFTGFLFGGGTVSQTFSGITTATVVEPMGFHNLTSLNISAAFDSDAAFDNISVQVVPEPAASTFCLLGLFGLMGRRRR